MVSVSVNGGSGVMIVAEVISERNGMANSSGIKFG